MFRRLSLFSKNLFKDNGIDRKSISESKRKDIFSKSDSAELSSTSTNVILSDKTKIESFIKNEKIKTLDWKTNNPNIKGKSSDYLMLNRERKNEDGKSVPRINDNGARKLYAIKKNNNSKLIKKDTKRKLIVEKKSNFVKKEDKPCKSSYGSHIEKIEKNGSGIKNAFNNFINRRKTIFFENFSSLKEFQESLSNESSNNQIIMTTTTTNNNDNNNNNNSNDINNNTDNYDDTNDTSGIITTTTTTTITTNNSNDISSNNTKNNNKNSKGDSNRSSNLSSKQSGFSSSIENLDINDSSKKLDKKSLENINEVSEKNINSNISSFLKPPSIFGKSNFNSKTVKNNNSSDRINKLSSEDTKQVNSNDKILVDNANKTKTPMEPNSSNLPTTPKSKQTLQDILESSPGSNEIERLKMIFMNCTQKLQNSEDISNDISAFYSELSKLENVLDSPSRKKSKDDTLNKPIRRSSKVYQKPVAPPPPPPPPPPMFNISTIKASGLQDVLAYNKNTLKMKKKKIVNKDLVPNSNFMDQLIEEFKSKTNKKNSVRINTNVKRNGSGVFQYPNNESPVFKPFLRHVRRQNSDNSIKKYKSSKIDFRKNLKTASRDPEFQRNLINELESSIKRKSSIDSSNRRYTMSYIPSYKTSTIPVSTATKSHHDMSKSKIPVYTRRKSFISDSIEKIKHQSLNNKEQIHQTKNIEIDGIENQKTTYKDNGDNVEEEMSLDEINENGDNDEEMPNIEKYSEDEEEKDNIQNEEKYTITSSSKQILESIKDRPKISSDMINQKLNNLNKTDKKALNKKTLLDIDSINFDSKSNIEIDTTSLFSNSTHSRVCRIKQSFEQNSLSRILNNNFKRKDSLTFIKEKKQAIHNRRRLSSPRKLSFNLYNGYNYNYIKKQPYRRYSDSFDLKKLPKLSYHIKHSNLLHHPKIKNKTNNADDSEMVTTRLSLSPSSSTKLSKTNNLSTIQSQSIQAKSEFSVGSPTTLRASPEPEYLQKQVDFNEDSILEEDESIFESAENSTLEESKSIIESNEEFIINENIIGNEINGKVIDHNNNMEIEVEENIKNKGENTEREEINKDKHLFNYENIIANNMKDVIYPEIENEKDIEENENSEKESFKSSDKSILSKVKKEPNYNKKKTIKTEKEEEEEKTLNNKDDFQNSLINISIKKNQAYGSHEPYEDCTSALDYIKQEYDDDDDDEYDDDATKIKQEQDNDEENIKQEYDDDKDDITKIKQEYDSAEESHVKTEYNFSQSDHSNNNYSNDVVKTENIYLNKLL
ncbi:hypothetical protein BCR36DRAFT_409564 [Piromyces finnis]|uniref:Uncharacterized protein n=1 Tax=Piromyces finnis TaxID=1754191 RepID=A0A1Y1VIM8_9FUNG|nr:hypothetical protein BCR36DRAFT_409564 [Piromyces finnis]|eukprot:ORX57254.1 hypothetical protein BCR36DRAFT_409564 [Piromyces finnis]